MRAFNLTDTEVDLNSKDVPFLPGFTVVAVNPTAGPLVIQEADESGGAFTQLASVPAGEALEVTFNKQFVQLSTAATLPILGN